LKSINETAPNMKVVVINNGDSLTYSVPENVGVYDTGRNLGFAGAHKFAKDLVTTKFTLLLNDDMLAPNQGWLEQMLLMMNNPQVGVVGPKLLFGNGSLQFAGGVVDWNRPDIGFHRNYGGQDGVETSTPIEVDFITGACLLCKTELYEIDDRFVGGLDAEDVDLCFTAKQKGYRIVYQPSSVLYHFEGQTKQRTAESQEKSSRNKKLFTEKWRK
jgi:GT2 family glycosyltransferase